MALGPPTGRLLAEKGGSTVLLWWPRFPGGPGGAWSGLSSEQPFPHPLLACAQSVTVCSEQSKSEALPHRNWLTQAQPTGEGPMAGTCLGQRPNTPQGSLWSAVAHRALADAGRTAVPFGAAEGHTSVFQLVLKLRGWGCSAGI